MKNFLDLLKCRFWEIGFIARELQAQRTLFDQQRVALGRIEARQQAAVNSLVLTENEFSVFSQWGEDGIIQFLLRHVPISGKVFVEFGVESYIEANTRFLLLNNNWKGLIMDGSEANMASVRRDPIYWQYNLKAVEAFITAENINELLASNGAIGEIGLLSIDIDGNDYWVWECIQCVRPAIVIVEYNSLFGPRRKVTIPYNPNFVRSQAHFSHSYYGASLAALVSLGARKGYSFVGSNSAGNNAFFIRTDLRPSHIRELTAADGYVRRSFREARDQEGKLMFPSFDEEADMANALPLVEVP